MKRKSPPRKSEFHKGQAVVWARGSYYGIDCPDETAIIIDVGKTQVNILCLDGSERWVKKESIR